MACDTRRPKPVLLRESAKCRPRLLPADRQPASGKEAVGRVVQAETGPPVQLEVRCNQIGQAGVVVVLRAVVARIAAKEGEPLVEDVQLLGQFILDGGRLGKL